MNKRILQLALPNIISNIAVPLTGIIDLALVGHLDSDAYIGAIALGTMIFNLIYWAFAFIRMGTSGFTAQAYGKRNLPETYYLLNRSLLMALAGALILILFQKPIDFFSFHLLNANPEVERLASEYFRIRVWAAPATLGLFSLSGWYIGMQNAKIPMIISLSGNILNLIFNLIFVLGLKMNSVGVAYGTVISQYISFFIAIFFFFRYYKRLLKFKNWNKIFKTKELFAFFHVNKDIFIRMLCMIFVHTFFTSVSAGISETILAVNTLILQFFMFYSYLIDGFAYAAESLSGKAIGAGNKKDLKKVIKYIFYWGTGVSFVFTLVYLLADSAIVKLLTNSELIRQTAEKFLFWTPFIPLISFAAFVWDGIYIGATASKEMRNTVIVGSLFIFLPAYYLSKNYIGPHSLWLAILLFMLTRGIMQTLLAKKAVYSKISNTNER